MAQTVIGIFRNSGEAQSARQHLLSNGFQDSNVDISSQSNGEYSSATETRSDGNQDFGSKVSNFFSNLFSDDNDRATQYSKAASGSIVVTVHALTNEEAEMAADILDDYGAVDVDENSSEYGTRNTTSQMGRDDDSLEINRMTDSDSNNDSGIRDNSDNDSISVIKEDLQIGKKEVEGGGKRLRSRIVERPVEETIRLREEHVHIERTPVDRVATDAEISGLRDQTIELTEHSEVPIVTKEARVVEEISISKEVEEREETIRDSVRHTEVETEDLDSENHRGNTNYASTDNSSDGTTDTRRRNDGYVDPDDNVRI